MKCGSVVSLLSTVTVYKNRLEQTKPRQAQHCKGASKYYIGHVCQIRDPPPKKAN